MATPMNVPIEAAHGMTRHWLKEREGEISRVFDVWREKKETHHDFQDVNDSVISKGEDDDVPRLINRAKM